MRTVIVTGLHMGFALPLLLGFALIGKALTRRVTAFIYSISNQNRRDDPGIATGIWLFTLCSMLAILSPATMDERIRAVLMLAFLYQMGVTDAVSGYLPQTFTFRFLLAGILSALLEEGTVVTKWQGTLIMGGLMLATNALANRRMSRLGKGDLVLITGLTAWFGLTTAALATLGGLVGFVLWQCTWHISGNKEGPLGPWLCIASAALLLNHLYQPVWIIY